MQYHIESLHMASLICYVHNMHYMDYLICSRTEGILGMDSCLFWKAVKCVATCLLSWLHLRSPADQLDSELCIHNPSLYKNDPSDLY